MSRPSLTVSKYLEQCIAMCGVSQREIARRCDYVNPNIITMFKTGKTKLPLAKVGTIAEAVGGDAVYLLRLALQEYMPETWDAIREVLGKDCLLSKGERALLQHLRDIDAIHPIDLEIEANRRILCEAMWRIGEEDQERANAAVRALNALPKNARHKDEIVCNRASGAVR